MNKEQIILNAGYNTMLYTMKMKLQKKRQAYLKKMGNRFIAYDGMIGKIKKVDDAYGFFKKGSKKHYYPIGNACMLILET